MKKILKKFTILAVLVSATWLYGEVIVTGNRVNLQFDSLIDPEKQLYIKNYVNEVDSVINKMMKRHRNKNACNVELKFFYGDLPQNEKAEFFISKDKVVYIDFTDLQEIEPRKSFEFRRRLISAVMQAYIGDSEAKKPYKIPQWIALSVDSQANLVDFQNKPFVKTRYLPGLKMLILSGAELDYEQVEKLDSAILSPIELLIYGDLCRFIVNLTTLKDNKLLMKYLSTTYIYQKEGKSDIPLLHEMITVYLQNQAELFSAEQQQIRNRLYNKNAPAQKQKGKKNIPQYTEEEKIAAFKRYLKFFATNYAFNSGCPYLASQAEAVLQQISILKIPVLNEKNELTQEFIEVPIHELPKLMRDRPDAELIKYNAIYEFELFYGAVAPLVKVKVDRLLKDLYECKNSWLFGTSQSEIKEDLEELSQVINQQKEIEAFLLSAEAENLNLYQRNNLEMKTIQEYYDSMSSSEIRKIMQETEELFYGTF